MSDPGLADGSTLVSVAVQNGNGTTGRDQDELLAPDAPLLVVPIYDAVANGLDELIVSTSPIRTVLTGPGGPAVDTINPSFASSTPRSASARSPWCPRTARAP